MLDMFPANRIIHQAFGDLQGIKDRHAAVNKDRHLEQNFSTTINLKTLRTRVRKKKAFEIPPAHLCLDITFENKKNWPRPAGKEQELRLNEFE